ncbi:MAG TPA: hypothetical protein DCW52_13225 [Gammaproteobacteria bacterium]|nr:hypothetical protein [Gammaproteobacteria bacterium]
MREEQINNPLHGVKLETLLTELVTYYGFDILAEQININCFKSNPSIKSSLKFLRRAPWARNKVEAFYLYKFKQLPRPSDDQHKLQPGERAVPLEQVPGNPAQIRKGDKEFFDDPASGPVKKKSKETSFKKNAGPRPKASPPSSPRRAVRRSQNNDDSSESPSSEPADPWGKWRDKEEDT